MNAALVVEPAPDPVVVLLAHMACADHQLHFGELRAIRLVAERLGVNAGTHAACDAVFNGQIAHDARRSLAQSVPAARRMMALEMLVAVAYADGACVDSERCMLEEVAHLWGFTRERLDAVCASAGDAAAREGVSEEDERTASLGARLISVTDRLLSARLVDRIAGVSDAARDQVDRLRREFLLAGPGYQEAVRRCAATAREDHQFAREALSTARNELQRLTPALDAAIARVAERAVARTATTARQLKEQFEVTRDEVAREAGTRLSQVARTTAARQRALQSFTVAFMGRTKAGKSTLHAVVTGQGWEGIGVGAQRTTRMNRVYEWRHLRIIDTPGVGAPGGLSDEEIAAQVIPEADVICYVVTNDSQQETEFRFLKVLKEQAKPLIVLLNVKENLRDAERLRRFLRDPGRPFRPDGPSGLRGHVERIRRYAREHYANDYFSIVPVHLLAAQMACEGTYRESADALMRASRLPDFLDGVRASLIEMGPLRRSQTLLAGTIAELHRTLDWLKEQNEAFKYTAHAIEQRARGLQPALRQAGQDAAAQIEEGIRTVFADVHRRVDGFADEHWEDPSDGLNAAWAAEITRLQVDQRLTLAQQACAAKYGDRVREALDELGRDLELNAQLNVGFDPMRARRAGTFWKNLFRWGGNLLSIVGVGVALVLSGPVGAAIGLVGGALRLLSELFEGRDKKRSRAVAQLSRDLHEAIGRQEASCIEAARLAFRQQANATESGIREHFGAMVHGLGAIGDAFAAARASLQQQVETLDRAYAKRVLDWVAGVEEPLTHPAIARGVESVTFAPGRRLEIRACSPVRRRRTTQHLQAALQHDVAIEPLTD